MAKVGDIVRYLNDVGGGRVVRIEGNTAWVDDDGFETPVLVRECVVVRPAEETAKVEQAMKAADPAYTAVAPRPVAPAGTTKAVDMTADDDAPVDEVEGGDALNVTLGFEPTERARLSETDFDASLINDSNFYLYFVLASRDNDEQDWTTRYAGVVEPNTELWLGTFLRSDIARFDNLGFQYVAFKKGRDYQPKQPGWVRVKVDTTKFFKLHCYRSNRYFENDVLVFALVTDDVPYNAEPVDVTPLQTLQAPQATPRRPERRPVVRRAKQRPSAPVDLSQPLVVDLHIDELVDTTAGMSAADILNYQVDTFQRIMNENLRNYGRKIIFIHGKGEGVLRQALTKELNNRYRGHDVQDASFREYGYGATQVTIRQHPGGKAQARR